VTICTWEKEFLLGKIEHGQVVLSEAGEIAQTVWSELPGRFPFVTLDEYVVMPNHVHGIVWIRRGDRPVAPTPESASTPGPKPKSIGSFVAGFKSAVTKQINETYKTPGQKLWQRNYYERVIRGEKELNQVRQYIVDNPAKWDTDEENPNVKPAKS
jgi:REP element-mobilizing transposase RayT